MNNSANILVVDDNADNLKVVSNFLKTNGYNIALALNGESALKAIENNDFDLILLDVMMPGMDGFEVCMRLKEDSRMAEIPIIFLTAKVDTADLVKGFQIGGVDYITKPFNREELLIRVKTHLDLSFSKKKLIETIKTRDKLYSIISHDLRTPFSSIKILLNTIAYGAIDTHSDDFKQLMITLENATNHTSNLLTNLLTWTKSQIGNINLNFQVLAIKPIIDDCLCLYDANAKDKNIVIENMFPEHVTAMFDEITIHTVLRNILSNALKFTPNDGHISITCQTESNKVNIIINDNGVGMSQATISKIFDNNQHYTSKGTNNEQGSGLGLYLVKELIDQNNGTISVESSVGQGTTFTIALPMF